MSQNLNPYASPQSEVSLAPGATWVQAASPELAKTQLGLSLVFYGIIVLLLSALLAGIGGAAGALPIVVVGAVGAIIGALMQFVGPIFCLSVPDATGAKGFIVGAVVCQFANIAGSIIQNVAPKAVPEVVVQGLGLLGLVSSILFVLFLKKLAEYIGRFDLAARARNVLIIGASVIAIGVVVLVGLIAQMPAFGLLGIVMLIVLLVGLVMYVNLINSLRKALAS